MKRRSAARAVTPMRSRTLTPKPRKWLQQHTNQEETNMNKLPAEIVASLHAVTTIFITITAFHFPPRAIFITWAATFAAGGPTSAVMKKFYPTMAIGGFFACAIVVCFKIASQYFTGTAYLIAECVIQFTLNATMMLLG